MTQLPEDILLKIRQFCAFRERCHKEVRSKLLEMKVYGEQLEEVITHLIQEDFLNEERFARSYARAKFNLKRWGRNKIRQELRIRGITGYCMDAAMEEIPEDEYGEVLRNEIRKKAESLRGTDKVQRLRKVSNYLITRGYEPSLVFEMAKDEIG